MERLWSQVGATGGNRCDVRKPRERQIQVKTVAVGCHWFRVASSCGKYVRIPLQTPAESTPPVILFATSSLPISARMAVISEPFRSCSATTTELWPSGVRRRGLTVATFETPGSTGCDLAWASRAPLPDTQTRVTRPPAIVRHPASVRSTSERPGSRCASLRPRYADRRTARRAIQTCPLLVRQGLPSTYGSGQR